MLTVKGATHSVVEKVAQEECEEQRERSLCLHGSGRRAVQIQAIKDLFKKEFDCEMQVTGTGAHHQNGLVERGDQTMDKAIRVMLIGAGLPVKFRPCAFQHFL